MARKINESHSQPRALTPDLELPNDQYRASMYSELQKFPNKQKARQLLLDEGLDKEEAEKQAQITGLDFSLSQSKALSALQLLLDRTGYQGNLPGDTLIRRSTGQETFLPALSFTPSEYLEAYGLRITSAGTFSQRQREEAMKALYSLAESRSIIYKRPYRKNGKKKYQVIREIVPLIKLIDYSDIEEGEEQELEEGKPSERVTKIAIMPAPLLVEDIGNFFLLKPPGLHQEIEDLIASKREGKRARLPVTYSLFIEWLLTKNEPVVKVGKEELAERLRLDKLIQQRKRSEMEQRLQESLEIAQELGFLLKFKEDAFGRYILSLNPKRCRRVKKALGEGQEEEAG